MCGGRRQRGEPEDEKVHLIGETAAILVAEKAGDERADGHADKRLRDEIGDEGRCRETGLQKRGQHIGADIEVVAVEKHAGADEPEDAFVKRRNRQPIKACASVHGTSHRISPPSGNDYV